ncbi:hypothetical protein AUEXF2481DRAFT_628068 [Aureobasidium subglaciale EXF-2481]|uniref:Uncharacterized protein n=1 Tax=Aureobasidium subglaciale (strain EXF-2481) TaxID=1043005 RepID=A0A074ZEI6_AURSE|nr:uncharacterized protein AUEXF2481DRAFT_628068 [Aureobasidium subglaciale EXF-2481]KAI5200014.1 hypothetical protein E4T38_06754 [Aureobasidium subglaciale]KAI5222463.1 hypothetical protein E4T41_06605 [Aureobasidium subglaciale]KAI5223272.1 hypothetical protein E4T40_04521 [Aureobasidium subglaciale]KAI5259963.1 hypothetical protein E4T46_06492 [Aureobasidium subglaciale]KEQ97056.1 hypothetical protein AUEXF2481DRAFT_628068 [Aureobasidium subglaciale EXF-2481]
MASSAAISLSVNVTTLSPNEAAISSSVLRLVSLFDDKRWQRRIANIRQRHSSSFLLSVDVSQHGVGKLTRKVFASHAKSGEVFCNVERKERATCCDFLKNLREQMRWVQPQ